MQAKKWKLSDEAKAKIPDWNQRWIKEVICRTEPLTAAEKSKVANSIRQMYRLAKLDGDAVKIVFVPSPLMAAVVAGAAAAWWHVQSASATDEATDSATASATDSATTSATREATREATYSATTSATREATYSATYSATREATREATYSATTSATASATDSATTSATREATYSATREATREATYSATASATDSATREATREATYSATADGVSFKTMLKAALSVVGDSTLARACVVRSYNMRNGGNLWAYWCVYLSFIRDVIGFSHPSHEAYALYETATMAGPRYMHKRFCIISDLPTVLQTYSRDGVLVPHCADGPSHAWADGWKLWYLDGVEVDEQIVMWPETQTVGQIRDEQNEEVKRLRIERFAGAAETSDHGWRKYLKAAGAARLDERANEIENSREALFASPDGMTVLLCACPSTARRYALEVPSEIKSCEAAQAWLWNGGRYAELLGAGRCIGRS